MTLPFSPAISCKVCLLIPFPIPTATVYKSATCRSKQHKTARFYWVPDEGRQATDLTNQVGGGVQVLSSDQDRVQEGLVNGLAFHLPRSNIQNRVLCFFLLFSERIIGRSVISVGAKEYIQSDDQYLTFLMKLPSKLREMPWLICWFSIRQDNHDVGLFRSVPAFQ